MKTILVVTDPFADYAKGDHITDHDDMAKVLESNRSHVVRTAHPGDDFYGDTEKAAPKKAAPHVAKPTA